MLSGLRHLGFQFTFLLGIYSLLRFMFLAYNWSSFQNFDQFELLHSLLLGLKFDISSLLMLNMPFFFYWLFPSQRERSISLYLFFAVNIVFLCINVADLELIRFNGRRLTPFYFLMSQDVSDQLGQLILHFWYLTFAVVALSYVLIKYFPQPYKSSVKAPIFHVILLYVFFLPVWLLGVRGGLRSRPVREANAYIFSSPKLGNLALNSTFTFVYGRKSSLAERYDFFTEQELEEFKRQLAPIKSEMHGRFQGSNVMIIIMESFAREYMGKVNGREGYTPFIDELSEKSLFFVNAYANGRRSIDSIPSILAGVPALGKEAFLLSGRQNTRLLGYPKIFKDLGYSTNFFHAAKNGSMFFDVFTRRIGIEKYSGLSQYPSELRDKDYDGYWGIWDKPYFQFVNKETNALPKPFFTTMFSLSAHQPYDLPKGLEDSYPKGSLEIHPTVAYSDDSLREFFQSIQNESWYSDTLFVVTADHTSQTDDPAYANQLGEYRIPILFYHPSFDSWPKGIDRKIIKHTDILPTVLDLVGVENQQQATGQSAFSDKKSFVVNRVPGAFWYLDNKGLLQMDLNGKMLTAVDDIARKNLFRAYVQYVVNGVNDNKLVSDPKPSED